MCVCIYHGGFEEDLETGERLTQSRENVACEIARKLGYDFLLTGHQHIAMAGKNLHGTYAVQPPANAGKYIRLEAVYGETGNMKAALHEMQNAKEGKTADAGKSEEEQKEKNCETEAALDGERKMRAENEGIHERNKERSCYRKEAGVDTENDSI